MIVFGKEVIQIINSLDDIMLNIIAILSDTYSVVYFTVPSRVDIPCNPLIFITNSINKRLD